MSAVEQLHQDIERGLPWLSLDLPCPPSVNTFMRKLGNKSPNVRAWARQADMALIQARTERSLARIHGPYEAQFVFKRHRGDLSNRIKPLEDWLQQREIIQDDKFCQRLMVCWSEIECGVRVRLRPWQSEMSKEKSA